MTTKKNADFVLPVEKQQPPIKNQQPPENQQPKEANVDLIKSFKSLSEVEKNSFLIQLIEQQNNEMDLLKNKNQELQEENKTWQLVSNSDDLFEMSEVAKVLNYKGFGRNKIFELLRDIKILRPNSTEPYQSYVDLGYFKIIEQVVEKEFNIFINLKTVVTQKGIDFIRRKLDEYTNK